ncbi:hypothetical protein AC579_5677 [Pseudocercospora musae]|uniref:MaoC-like domain-containing protein n=1 Tax=Pseudocercospora musae TaxID=113226 RepID=A0A139HCI4_9PEZI|nr:hypothetical protein AC579_5677 [Pseudocercospora musae]
MRFCLWIGILSGFEGSLALRSLRSVADLSIADIQRSDIFVYNLFKFFTTSQGRDLRGETFALSMSTRPQLTYVGTAGFPQTGVLQSPTEYPSLPPSTDVSFNDYQNHLHQLRIRGQSFSVTTFPWNDTFMPFHMDRSRIQDHGGVGMVECRWYCADLVGIRIAPRAGCKAGLGFKLDCLLKETTCSQTRAAYRNDLFSPCDLARYCVPTTLVVEIRVTLELAGDYGWSILMTSTPFLATMVFQHKCF